ncbi:MAG: outer membrane receptor protein involved in Fe transport [Bacteroidia bacterium]|jgi:outer membrane receptor protein involved in Fe transport
MRRLLLSLVLSFAFIIQATGQDVVVSGVITDKESNEPLVGASVIMEDKTGVTTDLDGKFGLKLSKGVHTLTFSFIGYKPQKREVDLSSGAPLIINVSLGTKSEVLDIVVVSSSQYQKSIAEETVSMEVVSKELIRSTNATDLGDAIDKTPGVTVTGSSISIRGGSSWSYGVGTRTAVMQDGTSMMSADLGEAQLTQSPVENIEQIEVIKGASSVVYGSSALNGVVNVITSWPKSSTPKTEVSVFQMVYDDPPDIYSDQTYESKELTQNPAYPNIPDSTILVDVTVNYPTDTLKWWDNGQVRGSSGMNINHTRKIKNVDLIVGANIFNHRSFQNFADEFRAGFNFKTRVHSKKKPGLNYGVNGTLMYEKSGRFFLALNPNEGALRSAVPSDDEYLRSNLDPHLHYISEKGFKHSLESRYMYIMRISRNLPSTPHAKSHQIMANYQFQKLWKKWSITSGVPLNVGLSSSNLYTGLRTTYSTAIYLQGEFKHNWITKKGKRDTLQLSKKTWERGITAVAGVRYEIIGIDDFTETSQPVFRSGLNIRAAKGTFIRASVGQSYRLPSVGERYLSADLSGLVQVIPNRQLTSEKGLSVELGLKQAVKVSKWLAYLDFAVFYQQYKDFVEFGFVTRASADSLFTGVPESIAVGLYPQNVSDALVAGYELGLASQGKIGPVGINALVGYTYNYPVNLDSAKSFGAEQYVGEFFSRMFKRLNPEESEYLLKLRPRHLIKGDVALSYKKATFGVTLVYGSYPENIPATERLAVDLMSGELGATERYGEAHQKGDLVINLRASYQILKQLKATFIVNNVSNKIYAYRPSAVEPIRNFTVKLRATF